MDKYIKFANALKSRGYKMRLGLDETSSALKVSIFPVRETYSFVQNYVYVGCYPEMDAEGFILPDIKFKVFSKVDKDTFLSLSDRELNAVVTTRNDLIYFCKLLNELGVSFDKDFMPFGSWWLNPNSFILCMYSASVQTGAVVLRDFPFPFEETVKSANGGASNE